MHTSDPSAEGTSPAPGAESPAPAAADPSEKPAAPAGDPPQALDVAAREAAPVAGEVAAAVSDVAAVVNEDAAREAAPVGEVASETNDAAARAEEEGAGPAIELALETVELSAAEADAVASPPAEPIVPMLGSQELPAVAAPAAPVPYVPSNWFLGITAFLVTAADLGTKEWAKHMLAGPELKRSAKHIEAIPGHLDFIFAQNPGGAWSFLRSVPDGIRRPFFLFVSAAAIVFIVTVYGRLERRQWAMRWGLPLALGGAIGNLTDRMRYGWVVDFIDAYYKGGANEVHWPTFNVADVAIVFGVGLMALDLLSLRRAHPPAAPAPRAETAGGAA